MLTASGGLFDDPEGHGGDGREAAEWIVENAGTIRDFADTQDEWAKGWLEELIEDARAYVDRLDTMREWEG